MLNAFMRKKPSPLKDQLDQRFVAAEDWANKQIDLEKTRAAWKLALLKEEEEQAKKIELPNKRAGRTAEDSGEGTEGPRGL